MDPFTPLHSATSTLLQNYRFPSEFQVAIKRPLIPPNDASAAAINFIDSFYTLSPDHSVLFLDPNTELSKHYAHYLLYATLEYRYSTYQSSDTSTLLGISLEPPPYYLSGAIPGPSPNTFSNNTLPFLYPAPVSRAALYFPQHWSELHSYVAHKLAPHASSSSSHPLPPPLQLGPAIADSWRSHLVELSRARGYAMLYPSFPDTLALVHNDTSRAPAEKRLVGAGGFLSQLPHEDLPAWGEMGFLDMWGKKIDGPEGGVEFEAATLAYRAGISNCPAAKEGAMWEVDDLFCDEAVKSV